MRSPCHAFAANLSMLFQDIPFLDRYEAAAKAGFKAVETLFPYEFDASEIKSRLDRFGLTQVLINTPPGDWNGGERGLARTSRSRSRLRQELRQGARLCRSARLQHDPCHGRHHAQGCEPRRCRDVFVANLLKAAAKARREGVTLLIEPLNTRDMPGYLHSTNR